MLAARYCHLTFTDHAYGAFIYANVVSLSTTLEVLIVSYPCTKTDEGTSDFDGLLGLGFDGQTTSGIEEFIQFYWGNDTTLGRTTFTNILTQNSSLEPYVDISLQRPSKLHEPQTGTIIFGAHEPGFDSVAKEPVLANVSPYGSTIYVDGMSVNGQSIPFNSSVPSYYPNPPGKLNALLDTGTTRGLLPHYLADAIYATIPGTTKRDGFYLVPCLSAVNVTFTIGYAIRSRW